eukprot:PhF_6_TR26204/c0_g1_i1/m.37315
MYRFVCYYLFIITLFPHIFGQVTTIKTESEFCSSLLPTNSNNDNKQVITYSIHSDFGIVFTSPCPAVTIANVNVVYECSGGGTHIDCSLSTQGSCVSLASSSTITLVGCNMFFGESSGLIASQGSSSNVTLRVEHCVLFGVRRGLGLLSNLFEFDVSDPWNVVYVTIIDTLVHDIVFAPHVGVVAISTPNRTIVGISTLPQCVSASVVFRNVTFRSLTFARQGGVFMNNNPTASSQPNSCRSVIDFRGLLFTSIDRKILSIAVTNPADDPSDIHNDDSGGVIAITVGSTEVHGTISDVVYQSSSGRLFDIRGRLSTTYFANLTFRNITVLHVVGKYQSGGVFFMEGNATIQISDVFAVDVLVNDHGGIFQVGRKIIVTIVNTYVENTTSGMNGGMLNVHTYAYVTLTNVTTWNVSTSADGGIISVESNSSVIVTNLTASNCYSLYNGGLLAVSDAGSLTIKTIMSFNNTAGRLGGVLCVTGDGRVNIENLTTYNTTGTRSGGVVNCDSGEIRISALQAYHSTTDADGGVINAVKKCTVIVGTLYAYNSSSRTSGGVILAHSDVIIRITTFTVIGAISRTGTGGTLFGTWNASITITKDFNVFLSSCALSHGGVFSLSHFSTFSVATMVVEHVSSGSSGGVGAVWATSSVDIGTIFVAHSSSFEHGGALFIDGGNMTVGQLVAVNTSSLSGFGGLLCTGSNSNVTINKVVVNGTSSGQHGGVIGMYATSVVNITELTTVDAQSATNGGVAAVWLNAVLNVVSMNVKNSYTRLNGGVLSVWGSGKAQVNTLVSHNSSSSGHGGVLGVAEKGRVLFTDSFTSQNSRSDGHGGVVAALDVSGVQLQKNIIIVTSQSRRSGGVVFCDREASCTLHDITSAVSVRSVLERGGFLGGFATPLTTVNISCRAGVNNIDASTGLPGGGGCVHIESIPSSSLSCCQDNIALYGCTFRCGSCDTDGMMARQTDVGNVILSNYSIRTEKINFNTNNNRCPIAYGCQEGSTVSPLSCDAKPTTTLTKLSSSTSSQLPSVISNTVRAITAAGVFFTSTDLIIGAQTIEAVSKCKIGAYESNNNRRPYLSLGRIVPPPSTSSSDSMQDAWEVSMVLLTVGAGYIFHILIVGIVRYSSNKKDWIGVVSRYKYPQYSIRLHATMVLPVTACMTLVVSQSMTSLSVKIASILAWIGFLVCLLGFHIVISSNALTFQPLVITKGGPNWFSSHGVWRPKLCVSMAGMFFSSYRQCVEGVFVSPHVWFWVPMSVGVVLTILSSLVRDDNHATFILCESTAIVGGLLWLVFGVLLLYPTSAMSTGTALNIARSIRWFVTGLTMIVMAVITLTSGDGEKEASTLIVSCMVGCCAVVGMIETAINLITKCFTTRNKRVKTFKYKR